MQNLGNIDTIGNAWITMLKEILKNGKATLYNGDKAKPIQELVGTTFTIQNIIMPDSII